MDTYNHRIFFVEDEDQRDQCQFIYVPINDEKPKRCQKDGIYRIGLTIFLCGVHMPGFGRHPKAKATKVKRNSVQDELFALFTANAGRVVTFGEIEKQFPQFLIRGNLHVALSQLRKKTGSDIISVSGVGYQLILKS